MAQVYSLRGSSGEKRAILRPEGARAIAAALRRWLAEWRASWAEARATSALSQKLEGYDDHLLRDMGLIRTEDRLHAMEPVRRS